jgi:hypothetical protein
MNDAGGIRASSLFRHSAFVIRHLYENVLPANDSYRRAIPELVCRTTPHGFCHSKAKISWRLKSRATIKDPSGAIPNHKANETTS